MSVRLRRVQDLGFPGERLQPLDVRRTAENDTGVGRWSSTLRPRGSGPLVFTRISSI